MIYNKLFKYNTLRNELILLYVLTVFIPIFLIGNISLNIYEDDIVNKTTELTRITVNQTTSNINDLISEYTALSDRICFDDTLKIYLNPKRVYADNVAGYNAYQSYLWPMIRHDNQLKGDFATLKIYFSNPTLIPDYSNYIYASEIIKKTQPYKSAILTNGKMNWSADSDYIYFNRLLKDYYSSKTIAVVSVGLPEDRILKLINEEDKASRVIMVLNSDGNIIVSNDISLKGKNISNKSYFSTISSNNDGIIDYKDTKKYKIIYNSLPDTNNNPNWKIVSLIPINNLLINANRIKTIGLILYISSFILSCFIFSFFVNKITDKIGVLNKKMKGVKEGKFNIIEYKKNYYNNEIDILTDNYNTMVQGIKKLIKENYEGEIRIKDITIKNKEMELYALECQINPHFLFNTLESIRMSLVEKEDRATANIIFDLSNIIRVSLTFNKYKIQLKQEMLFVNSYLRIQKFRFREKLNFIIDIPEDLMNTYILKLSIQFAVDNAVKHGIENKKGYGNLWIKAIVVGENLVISIEDDGVGINESKLKKIRNEISQTDDLNVNETIGIKNINDRLVLNFGNDYRLIIESKENHGTTIIEKFPLLQVDSIDKMNEV